MTTREYFLDSIIILFDIILMNPCPYNQSDQIYLKTYNIQSFIKIKNSASSILQKLS